MRIAVYHDLPSGGAKRTLYETVKRLSAKHHVCVYTLDTADSDFCDLRPVARDCRVFPFAPLPLLRSPLGRLNQLQRWRTLRQIDKMARTIASEIDAEGFDVVFAQPCLWSQAPLVMQYLQTPVVYYCHEPPRHLYEPNLRSADKPRRNMLDQFDPLIALYRSAARQLDWEATRAARVVLVNSEYTHDAVFRIYGITPVVCYHGVDADFFCPQPWVDRRGYVLSVGAIQPQKGFDFLIESLACLPGTVRPSLRLVGNAEVAGERPYLESLAARLNVDLQIEIGLTQDSLVQRYNEAALVAYAPHNEPFGLVPLEAMACGTPVVAVGEGGIRESVVNGVTGLLVERHRETFADAVSKLFRSPGLRGTLGRQARELVLSRWTWEQSVERIERHLQVAAGERAGVRVER